MANITEAEALIDRCQMSLMKLELRIPDCAHCQRGPPPTDPVEAAAAALKAAQAEANATAHDALA